MLIAKIPIVGQIRCIFDDNHGIFFKIFLNHAILMNTISLFLRRTDQSCVLVFINIQTFSGLLISWVSIGKLRYFACKMKLSRNNLLSKSCKAST